MEGAAASKTKNIDPFGLTTVCSESLGLTVMVGKSDSEDVMPSIDPDLEREDRPVE
jgi:hypothetical protein